MRSRKASQRFGYEVSFAGVGTPQNALHECLDFLEEHPEFRDLGYCTQTAVFSRLQPRLLSINRPPAGTFDVITQWHYPRNVFDEYPPTPATLANRLGSMWRGFCPQYVSSPTEHVPPPSAHYFGAVYYEKKGVTVCRIALSKLWEYSYQTEKIFRFNKDIFMEVGGKLEHQEYDYGKYPYSHRNGRICWTYEFLRPDAEVSLCPHR